MESTGSDIKRYLHLINKRKYVFIITAISIVTIAVAISYLLPNMYEAKCTVFIERNVIENLIKDIAVTPSMEDRLKVLSYAMKSRNLLLKVIKELDLDVNQKNQAEIEKMIEHLQKNTTIDTDSKRNKSMNLFVVSYRDKDPVLAKNYVNTLVRRYIEENLSEKRKEAYGANRFLSEQIRFFKEKLDNVESELVNFRKERGIFIAIDERKVVDEIKNDQEALEELRIRRKELEAKKKLVEQQMKEENPYTVAIFGKKIGDPNDKLIVLQNKLNELLMKYTENYPEVIRVKAEIEALKEQLKTGQTKTATEESQASETEMSTLNPLYQQYKEELAKIGLELAALKVKEEHLKKRIESKKAYLRDIPAEKKKLMDMERERNTYKNIYEKLVYRLGQSEVSKQMEVQDKAATFRIVDPAVLPTKPVSPNRVKIILLGIFAAFAGGLGIVIALDHMDKSVKTVDALKTLGFPVLAIIPNIQNSEELMEKRKRDIMVYSLAGAYMLCILGIMTIELLKT
jgi:polysaccharide chain length determinant protein (PEP-CTERM system associated)